VGSLSYKCVPYIPIAEARGFTAHSGKGFDSVEELMADLEAND